MKSYKAYRVKTSDFDYVVIAESFGEAEYIVSKLGCDMFGVKHYQVNKIEYIGEAILFQEKDGGRRKRPAG